MLLLRTEMEGGAGASQDMTRFIFPDLFRKDFVRESSFFVFE